MNNMTFIRPGGSTFADEKMTSSPEKSLNGKSSPNKSLSPDRKGSPGNESNATGGGNNSKPKLSFAQTGEKESLSAMNMSMKAKKSTMSVIGSSIH
jgi:hypothetical protein